MESTSDINKSVYVYFHYLCFYFIQQKFFTELYLIQEW